MAYEADLIVTVADERINGARTPEEAVRYLGEVIPFVELLDLVLADGEPLNLATIAGYNVMSRSGIVGEGIPVEPTPAFIEALGKMEALTVDETGREIERAESSAILGHPLNVVLLARRARQRPGTVPARRRHPQPGDHGDLPPAGSGAHRHRCATVAFRAATRRPSSRFVE